MNHYTCICIKSFCSNAQVKWIFSIACLFFKWKQAIQVSFQNIYNRGGQPTAHGPHVAHWPTRPPEEKQHYIEGSGCGPQQKSQCFFWPALVERLPTTDLHYCDLVSELGNILDTEGLINYQVLLVLLYACRSNGCCGFAVFLCKSMTFSSSLCPLTHTPNQYSL